jgi:hypothetical protein
MSVKLQEAIKGYLDQGYKIVEQLSPTSVILFKKGFFHKKWLFLWTDDCSNVQISKHSLRDLTKKLAENVRLQRVLEAKMSWTRKLTAGKPYPQDLFGQLLVDEEEKNEQMLSNLKREKSTIEKEIIFRNCLGVMTTPIKKEVERCLNECYEVEDYAPDLAILKRRSPALGAETLKLSIGPSGNVQRLGESSTKLQERLDALISMFKLYRTVKPTPGREKQVLDKQFELDAEISALHKEMKYLGYTPNLKGHML